ncbi:hypothetical protein [Lentibacillus salicampi]|uniref:DUF4878 domain-containing protein n=1 Tax=Lentibacillus salicampi TaxID=175306 RepID=A0A4Y9A9Z0_9BACI|nr:hypothetical protein [Lentibacillus salicampi]TFJ92699.1 hypothetical protein E4U82_11145 [Lentibacillus salicampi]
MRINIKISLFISFISALIVLTSCSADPEEAAKEAATEFKEIQFDINYEEIAELELFTAPERIEEKCGDIATENEREYLVMNGVMTFIEKISRERQSDMSVNHISFETGNVEEDDERSFDYDIEISDHETGDTIETINDLGQLVVVKTEEGWKVDKDLQQMKGLSELYEKSLQ